MFTGRIGRLAFLLGYIYLQFPIILLILGYAMINAMGGDVSDGTLRTVTNVLLFSFGAFWTIFYVIGAVSLSVRRWHDINQTGWLAFLYVIPVASFVAAVVQLVVPGEPENNRYGAPTKGLGLAQVLFHKYPEDPIAPQSPTPPPPAQPLV